MEFLKNPALQPIFSNCAVTEDRLLRDCAKYGLLLTTIPSDDYFSSSAMFAEMVLHEGSKNCRST